MVKVSAPALSLEASGKLGGALVFASWKGRAYARSLVKPSNPKTDNQVGMRAATKFLAQMWATFGSGDQASWNDLAANANISPFNAYCSFNLSHWRMGFFPSKAYPANRALTPTTINTFTATAGARHITIKYSLTAAADQWGVAIARSTTNGFSPTWATTKVLIYCADTADHDYVDGPLDAGAYYYRACAFTDDGVNGVWKAQITATVT